MNYARRITCQSMNIYNYMHSQMESQRARQLYENNSCFCYRLLLARCVNWHCVPCHNQKPYNAPCASIMCTRKRENHVPECDVRKSSSMNYFWNVKKKTPAPPNKHHVATWKFCKKKTHRSNNVYGKWNIVKIGLFKLNQKYNILLSEAVAVAIPNFFDRPLLFFFLGFVFVHQL